MPHGTHRTPRTRSAAALPAATRTAPQPAPPTTRLMAVMNAQHYVCTACEQPWSRQAARGRVPRYCPDCRTQNRLGKTWSQCPWCESYGWIRRDAVYCSRTCATQPAAACVVPTSHPCRQERPRPRTWTAGQCAECAEAFVTNQPNTRYCSRLCGKRCERRRWKEAAYRTVPATVRRAVYLRDGAVCQLCHEAVDMTLPPESSLGPTLDHIDCQSWSLIPDHRASNLRLAHRLCNSVRGARRTA